MKSSLSVMLALLLSLPACAGAHKSEWDNIDYTRVYQHYRENDANYTPPVPTALGCVDDDLYNCR